MAQKKSWKRVRMGRRRHAQAALEFLLLLAFFILPMSFLAWALLKYQREMFDIFSWFLSLPVP